jgi:gliding motility-associated lipoprotein GldH
MKRLIKGILLSFTVLLVASCDEGTVKDVFVNIPNSNWSYDRPIKTVVDITDPSKPYTVSINFRHTEDYRYANLWVRVSVIGPSKKKVTERKEFQLALQDGEWLGKGSGNLYSYQLVFKEAYKFEAEGKYTFIIEQNMRDNPLKYVSDVGLRVEPAL